MVQAGGITLTPLTVGFANAAYNFFGNGNQVTAGDQASLFSLAFSAFGDRNDVVVNGPFAAGGALFQSDQTVSQTGPGIEINEAATAPGSTTNALAAGGTQGNRVGLNSTGNNTNGVAASGTQGNRVRASLNAAFNRPQTTSPGGSVRESVSKKFSKKFSDPASSSGTSSRGTTSSNGGSSEAAAAAAAMEAAAAMAAAAAAAMEAAAAMAAAAMAAAAAAAAAAMAAQQQRRQVMAVGVA